MHPYLTQQLVHEHVAELRRSSTRRPAGVRAGRRTSRRPLPGRERAGWLLVTVGLRLIGAGRRSAGTRHRMSPAAKKKPAAAKAASAKKPAAAKKAVDRGQVVREEKPGN